MTDHERLALDEEAQSLPIHVKMCAMRHAQILSRIDEADAAARVWRARIEKGVWSLVVMVAGAIGAGATEVVPIMRALAGQ